MIKNISHQVLSAVEINENFPTEILEELELRFYQACIEFVKMKKHQAKLKKKRGRACPWADKVSEDAWVRRVRKQWQERTPEMSRKKRGRPGWGFLVLLKIWIYAAFFGCEQNAEEIASALKLNPKFARVCGLPKKATDNGEEEYETPSARTLRHFNQVMYVFELWDDLVRLLVYHNIENKVFPWPNELAVDPTHLDAFARVQKTCHDCVVCPKSNVCSLTQVTCEMTGIVSKSENLKVPGVKLNFACLPDSEIVIMTIPCQGQKHDSKLFEPLLTKLAEDYPALQQRIAKILGDTAHDNPTCRKTAKDIFQAQLLSPINPRNRKAIEQPARGIDYIDPSGVPVCIAGHSMIMAGRDHIRGQYIWVCPVFNSQHGDPTLNCPKSCKNQCAPSAKQGRIYRVNKEMTPQIDWGYPQHLISFDKIYDQRTCVERAISRCKRILNFERFFNRGRKPLQAHGDRYVIAIQLVALAAHKLHRPQATRRYRLSG